MCLPISKEPKLSGGREPEGKLPGGFPRREARVQPGGSANRGAWLVPLGFWRVGDCRGGGGRLLPVQTRDPPVHPEFPGALPSLTPSQPPALWLSLLQPALHSQGSLLTTGVLRVAQATPADPSETETLIDLLNVEATKQLLF